MKRIGNNEKKKEKSVFEIDDDNFKECINVIANTKDGLYVLNRLMESCGFMRSSLHLDQLQKTDLEGTIYNEGRRSIWVSAIWPALNTTSQIKILKFDRRTLCQQEQKDSKKKK